MAASSNYKQIAVSPKVHDKVRALTYYGGLSNGDIVAYCVAKIIETSGATDGDGNPDGLIAGMVLAEDMRQWKADREGQGDDGDQ